MKVYVTVNAHPASDGKTLSLLKEKFGEENCYYAGGVSHGGYRILVVTNPGSLKEVEKVVKDRTNYKSCVIPWESDL